MHFGIIHTPLLTPRPSHVPSLAPSILHPVRQLATLQGYLTYKKTHPPRTLP